jgi:DNA-binding NtrC family response regulator
VTTRILIVDDDATTLKALSHMLRLEGYEVDTCGAPLPALAKLRAAAPDVLLTDQVMGEMTGLDLARQAIAEHAGVRCFVMSGHAAPSPSECAHVTWINKPIDIDALLSALAAGARG